ncbi:MAG: hypothetical protein R3C60_11790 [Parvularculaceae bacterium]
MMAYCKRNHARKAALEWIDNDPETLDFINYWFGPKQEFELRRVAKYFSNVNYNFNSTPINVLMVALSRLIITKEPKASLARDTAHSRPHKTVTENEYSIYENLESSVHHVLNALDSRGILTNSKTYLCDARNMARIPTASVDAIITSPPYLNAIDYMRGHKFSLIWFGFSLSKLRRIRTTAIGAETGASEYIAPEFDRISKKLKLGTLDKRNIRMLRRYHADLRAQLQESWRVIRKGRRAIFVVGNSSIRGTYIRNNEILRSAAESAGFEFVSETTREIPDKMRYMPMTTGSSNTLANRMRTEHIIELAS